MFAYANKSRERSRRSDSDESKHKSGASSPAFQLVNKRPSGTAPQIRLSGASPSGNSSQIMLSTNSDTKAQVPNNGKQYVNENIVQRVKKKRPSWTKDAKNITEESKKLLKNNTNPKIKNKVFDLAHKLSLHDIESIVKSGDQVKTSKMVEKLTTPERQFGNIKKGDQTYFNKAIKQITNQKKFISILNSSPYNLRPGDQSTNRSIGKNFDPNNYDDGSMTPQSKELQIFAINSGSGKSSSFLNNQEQIDLEKNVFN